MNASQPIECHELTSPDSIILNSARRLYESTLHPSERIPWESIERTIWAKATGSSACWNRHLLIAGDPSSPRDVFGYLVATFFPGYGGYVSYMGVDQRARGRGVGTMLYRSAIQQLTHDAELVDETLPFVVWESLAPEDVDERTNWNARTSLFQRVGASWVEGIKLWTPDYDAGFGNVPYQLFVRPVGEDHFHFTPGRLRKLVHDHYRRIYRQHPGDEHYDLTFAEHPQPRLRPANQAMACVPGEELGLFATHHGSN
jgi:GNAT superfamily N-acetyltransferase